jgi:hypothetical protein
MWLKEFKQEEAGKGSVPTAVVSKEPEGKTKPRKL